MIDTPTLQAVSSISPSYFKAMLAGRELCEVLDWANNLIVGRPIDEYMVVANKWIDQKAAKLGIQLPDVALTKSDWLLNN
jgi:hypothetical protein